jgi:hypothetical protein
MKNIWIPIAFAIATAFFWGVYGPALSKGRGSWSPFKPYMFIGVAYLVWGVLGGLGGMKLLGDNLQIGGDQFPATKWGFIAGSMGAFGALSLTAAVMNARGVGGPALVMPIVFGGATLINALTELIVLKERPAIDPRLWLGMVLVIGGIVLVRLYTPQGHAPAKPAQTGVAANISTPTP